MEELWKIMLKRELKKHRGALIKSGAFACFIALISSASPLFMRQILNQFSKLGKVEFLWLYIFLICLIPLLCYWLKGRYTLWVLSEINDKSGVLKQVIFINLLSQPLTYFERANAEKAYNVYSKDAASLFNNLLSSIPHWTSKVLTLVSLLLIMLFLNYGIFLLQLLFFISLLLLAAKAAKWKIKIEQCSKELWKNNYFIQALLGETFKLMGVLRFFSLETTRVKHLGELLKIRKDSLKNCAVDNLKEDWLIHTLKAVFTALSFGLGINSLLMGAILGGDLLAIMVYLPIVHTLFLELIDFNYSAFRFYQYSNLFRFLTGSARVPAKEDAVFLEANSEQ